jgi:hypothetical protein
MKSLERGGDTMTPTFTFMNRAVSPSLGIAA